MAPSNSTTKALLKQFIPSAFYPVLRRAYKQVYYFGLTYTCPFCKSHLKTFLPFGEDLPVLYERNVVGGGHRDHALCPICKSTDRDRLLYLYLLKKTEIFKKPLRVLHVAPESSLECILRRESHLDYLTTDLFKTNVMVKTDITNMNFPDHCFDAIICNHVLEHIVDDRKAMSELYRILKPGGWAILQVPISMSSPSTYEDVSITTEEARKTAFGQSDHVRIYGQDYQDRLTKAGFSVNIFCWIDAPAHFGGQRNAYSLNTAERIYHVSKPR
ncbi:MAG: methyltransferase domain-containing protein [Oscillochloris sp.]|nr:methyltransferase domain-containing protein [Oscillochloris sp.]